ncbi:MAG: hypothetical protein R2932_10975 [Caldilineaceae bacterium]
MTITWKRLLLWLPRILGFLFALFLSIFALDVFGTGYGIGEMLFALFVHLLPTFALLIALALAWRWEWIGALTFLGFAVWYVAETRGQAQLLTYLLIVGPPLLVGMLYLVDWFYRDELHPTTAI